MYMADYMTLLEDLIKVNKRPVLAGKGKVSAEQAKAHALEELKKFKERRLSPAEEDYMETIKALNQKAKENTKKLPSRLNNKPLRYKKPIGTNLDRSLKS